MNNRRSFANELQKRSLRVAVIEDNDEFAKELCEKLRLFATEKGQTLQIFLLDDALSLLRDYRGGFDIMFISVEHSQLDGISMARGIRRYDDDTLLFLLSEGVAAAVDGYDVRAFAYLLKDISSASLYKWLEAAVEKVCEASAREYVLEVKGELRRLRTDRIRYVEVDGHHLYFYVEGRTEPYTQRGRLLDIEGLFADSGFFRINKSQLVNINYVTAAQGNILRLGEEALSISRSRKKQWTLLFHRMLQGDRALL